MTAVVPRRLGSLLAAALLAPALPTYAGPTGSAPAAPAVVSPTVASAPLAPDGLHPVTPDVALVGVTWSGGAAEVSARWHGPGGWSEWDEVEVDTLMPEPAERAGTRPGTEPIWRPRGADLVQLRVAGTRAGLRLVTVSEQAPGGPELQRTTARSGGPSSAARLGPVGSRADWGADESIRGTSSHADRVDAVVVHHTAQDNTYEPADVPRLIRSAYAYHVQARGWSDLGYNLVVDRFGGIWEGRAGGLGRATIGSHAQGFNTRTLGVALLGDMTRDAAPEAVVKAMARVAAYAGATWRFDPRTTVTLTSRGSPKYGSGRQVRLSRVFGHQDTGQTACPGSMQDQLPEIRRGAAILLGPAPAIRRVVVTGDPVRAPAPLVVRAELSAAVPWLAEIRDPAGQLVRRVAGEGSLAELQWHGLVGPPGLAGVAEVLPAPPGSYTWVVQADDGYHRPARRTGTFTVGPPGPPLP